MALKIAEVAAPKDEKLNLRRKHVTDRDETQQDVDKRTGKAVAEWKAMPNHLKVHEHDRPRIRLAVNPDGKSELKRLIRRAATLHKVDPVYFEDATDSQGRAVVTYTVGPQPTAEEKAARKAAKEAAKTS